MPRQYEAMRDKFAKEGMNYDEAQGKAARIYNAKHPDTPVTGKSEKKKPPLMANTPNRQRQLKKSKKASKKGTGY